MKRTIIPKSQRAEVLREIAQYRAQHHGVSLKRACLALGHSYQAVNKWREECKAPTKDGLTRALEFYDRGLPLEESAARASVEKLILIHHLKQRRQKRAADAWRSSEKLQAKTGYVTA